jgi:membrane associated rhomboid family serine protease
MMPLGDDNTGRKSVPIVTYLLIAINVIVFLLEMSGGEEFIMRWSFVPSRFAANPVGDSVTILTSMFMHGGAFHLFGNMLYLWIFGDNVEDRFGKIPFLLFYLICGVAATFSQFVSDTSISIPNLGASGAIAGVLGAYILLYPSGKVAVLVGNVVTSMPALVVIGMWFVLQFFSTLSSMAETNPGEGGGVAYLAHMGGFIAGVVITFIYKGISGTPSGTRPTV